MTRFAIPDMECEGCVSGVTRAIRNVDATATVSADLPTRTVIIESAAPEATLAAAITEAGFTVQPEPQP